MAYEVLYRKYRPRDFAGLVGQDHVRKALHHALVNDRLHHAYLFTGTRGVGKTTIARIVARCLNCEEGVGVTPCGVCGNCRDIDAGRFMDLFEIDAASRTRVEDTRELLDNVQYPPVRGRYKVYLIDEVHMLSTSSFNALLKTLEEPPPRVVFLLATTDPKKLPVTVLSRCLQFALKSYRPEQIATHLEQVLASEAIEYEARAVRLLARAARGSMRDALSLTDQAIAHGGGSLTAAAVEALLGTLDLDELSRLARAIIANDAAAALAVSADLDGAGADFDAALQRFAALLHRVAVVQAGVTATVSDDESALASSLARELTPEHTQLLYQIALVGLRDLTLAPEPRIGFEMALLRMLAFTPELADDQLPIPAAGAASPMSSSRTLTTALPATARTDDAATTALPEAPPVVAPSRRSAVAPETAPPAVQPRAPAAAATLPVALDSATQGNAAAASGVDWFALAPRLALGGIARDIALHLTPRDLGSEPWQFELEPGRLSLLTPTHLDAVSEAIEALLGRRPELLVESARGPSDTASARLAVAERARREALLASVRSDPLVRALQDRFGASIDDVSLPQE